jgi:hypothetical protein
MERKGLPKLLKRVNERICELRADSLDAEAEFFCECGQDDCKEAISLTPRAYLGTSGIFLLAPGHKNPRGELRVPLTVLFGPFTTGATGERRGRFLALRQGG